LGGGITGLTVAERLSRTLGSKVVIIEKEPTLGGLAATVSRDGLCFDLGSHRVHPETHPAAIRYIEDIIQQPLIRRRRKGKLYFRGKFINYPPDIISLLKVFSSKDLVLSAFRYLKNLIFPAKLYPRTFETIMVRAVGRDIYNKLYRDYAKKLWGLEPAQISVEAAHRRKTVVDFKSLRNLFKASHYFLYPREGIGDIVKGLEKRVISQGALVIKEAELEKASVNGRGIDILFSSPQKRNNSIKASVLVSTIPIEDLYRLFHGNDINSASLRWRGVRLVYIVLKDKIKRDSETFYFPSSEICLGRVSEIKKYSPYINPQLDNTLLTIEIPVFQGDTIWEMPEQKLLELCIGDLVKAGILDPNPRVLKNFSMKLAKVYPLYALNWKDNFLKLYNSFDTMHNVFSVGRRGLFLHCNIDHCILQGLELSDMILRNQWQDKEEWDKKVARFLSFAARD
jgi:protoporphyrinogen oxidase